jgi:flagellar L-ring protein precursor FlgH
MKHTVRHTWKMGLPLVLVVSTAVQTIAQEPGGGQLPPAQNLPAQNPEVIEGPNSSLFGAKMRQQALQQAMAQPGPYGKPVTPLGSSWYETPLPPPKEVRKGDLIKIRVDLGARMSSDGEIQRRKNTQYDALLNDWVLLNGLRNVKPAPQSDGDQRVRGTTNQLYRATGELETSESIKFNITATVVDILPNGNVVLEAHWKINNNNEQWIRSLSGIVARENIGPGNLVLGEDVADLQIGKQEIGHVRDSYRRGWVTRLLDTFSPF